MSIRAKLSHLKNALLASKLSYPPGHFYSPICDPNELLDRYQEHTASELRGIDLNKDGQIARFYSWQSYLADVQFSESPTLTQRYYFGGRSQYPIGDAISLCCFMRELSPRRIIEVGCGFSSACVLDTIDKYRMSTECTFIDPYPDALLPFLNVEDRLRVSVRAMPVQYVKMSEFERLQAGDILLIDSTHVLKTCSDVAFELFDILPRLAPGVFVHFHDIHYPFEYPHRWVIQQNLSWNEAYAIRALLMYSSKFKIEFWNHYMTSIGYDIGHGGSLWLSVDRGGERG